MKQEVLDWMNQKYPEGFYCADIRKNFITISFSTLSSLNTPMLFHLEGSQLQGLIGCLIEFGFSPQTPCHLPESGISGTIGDIALRTRSLNLDNLFLVVAE
jgi:hypothetical protein